MSIKTLILAGGMGKRLWPVSRKKWPKYLMEFKGKSLLQQAYERVNTNDNNKYIAGAQDAGFLIKNNILKINSNFSDDNMVLEPLSKNTAPAIALGIADLNEEDIVVVLPADHIIEPQSDFNRVIEEAASLAQEGYIVTVGIKPQYPATGYGYIQKGNKLNEGWKVDSFKEKPDRERAQSYIESGNYFWNAGIFVFKVSVMKEEMGKHFPESATIFNNLEEDKSNLKDIYGKMPNISIDYAVMEKTERAAVVGFDGEWNDLGSWEAVQKVLSEKGDNYSNSEAEFLDCKNNFVSVKEGKFFAGVGLKDLIIVDSEDALLVLKKGEGQKVKEIVEKIADKDIVDRHLTDYRPWGKYKVLDEGAGYKTKVLFVEPGQRLSLQKHKFRDEIWTVIKGKGRITVNDKVKELTCGDTVKIPAGAVHRAENTAKGELKILELATGDKISEDDIIRLEDDYNR